MGEVTGTSDITNHIIGTRHDCATSPTVQGHQFCATFFYDILQMTILDNIISSEARIRRFLGSLVEFKFRVRDDTFLGSRERLSRDTFKRWVSIDKAVYRSLYGSRSYMPVYRESSKKRPNTQRRSGNSHIFFAYPLY